MLFFPLILILVQNILMNVSKSAEHNFAGLLKQYGMHSLLLSSIVKYKILYM